MTALLPEIIGLILDFATRDTLARCLRVNRSLLEMAGGRLYRDLEWEEEEGELQGPDMFYGLEAFEGSTNHKKRLLESTRTFRLHSHSHCILPGIIPDIPIPLPNVNALRISLERYNPPNEFCDLPSPARCAFLASCAPNTIILDNLQCLTAPTCSFGIRGSGGRYLPYWNNVETIIVKPWIFRTSPKKDRPRTVRSRIPNTGRVMHRLSLPIARPKAVPFLCELPRHVSNVVILYETLPDQEWPVVHPHTHPRHLPDSPKDLVEFASELVEVISANPASDTRKWTIVNVGRLDGDFVGLGSVGVRDMQSLVMQAFNHGVEQKRKDKVLDMDEEQVQALLSSIKWLTMEEYIKEGGGQYLDLAVEARWMREMQRLEENGEDLRQKELALIESFVNSSL